MKAVKGNKEYTIEQSQQKFYQDSGYDIKNDSGEIVAYGKGKTVPYGDHAKAEEEIGRLQDELARLESGQDSDGAIENPKNVCKGTRIDLGRSNTLVGVMKIRRPRQGRVSRWPTNLYIIRRLYHKRI